MVHLAKKKKKGKVYLYLQETGRIHGKSRRLWQVYLGPEHRFKERSQMITIPDVTTETIEFGLIAALLKIARKLGLVETIDKFTEKRNQGLSVGEHMLIAAINRCVDPVSKTQLKTWFDSTILRSLYPNPGSALDSRAYWTHSRYLNEKKIEKIGEELARAAMERFNVSFENLLFDPTNFFTYINPKHPNQTIPQHGYSKEGRHTLNLVNFSLFCALDGGVPFLHLIYPGNVNDSTHFKKALKRLQNRLERVAIAPSKITLTFDKGNLSKEAFTFIDEEEFEYIASIRPSTQKDILGIPPEDFSVKTLPNGKKIGLKEFTRTIYGKERRLIGGYNPNRAKLSAKNFEEKLDKKLEKIESFFKERLNTPRWSDHTKIREKCQKLLGAARFKKAVQIEISDKEGTLSLSVSKNNKKIREYLHTLGKSFLMTNRTDLTPLEIVWSYRQQYLVEHAFKLLKNPTFLSIRPMYAHTDPSIRAHCFICFIALLLLSLLVREVTQCNIPMSIPKIIGVLEKVRITRIHIPGRKHPIEKVDIMKKEARKVYNALT